MKNYDNLEYAKGRLIGTVVRVGGKAVHIDGLTKTTVVYTDFIEGKPGVGKVSDMDITPVPLGYCNTNCLGWDTTTYLVRYPVRKDWRQGLRHATLKTICNRDKMTSDMIPWADVFRTINGEFPKFEEVINLIQKNRNIKSRAYCREFAVYNDLTIWYKEQYCIGIVTDPKGRDGFVEIKEEFEWVRDAFEASVVW